VASVVTAERRVLGSVDPLSEAFAMLIVAVLEEG